MKWMFELTYCSSFLLTKTWLLGYGDTLQIRIISTYTRWSLISQQKALGKENTQKFVNMMGMKNANAIISWWCLSDWEGEKRRQLRRLRIRVGVLELDASQATQAPNFQRTTERQRIERTIALLRIVLIVALSWWCSHSSFSCLQFEIFTFPPFSTIPSYPSFVSLLRVPSLLPFRILSALHWTPGQRG